MDELLIVRGVNVFPSAIENVVLRFPQVGQFAVDVFRRSQMDEIELRLELTTSERDELVAAVSRAVRLMELAETEKEKKDPCVEAVSDEQLDSIIMEFARG
jgi:phenylacetate-coenzyme A ligase PaaK-like adenylate-forming protein